VFNRKEDLTMTQPMSTQKAAANQPDHPNQPNQPNRDGGQQQQNQKPPPHQGGQRQP
jgi:hypothetical protein